MLSNKPKTVNEMISPKMIETMLIHHLFCDLRNHMPAGITIKYLETVSFTCNTSGKKVVDK